MSHIYQDNFNISLPLAVYLCHDTYDHNPDPMSISATTLLKPMREIVLARQNNDLDKIIDISQLISSRMGTSIHDGAEEAWNSDKALGFALQAKGMLAIKDRIVINPTDTVLAADPSLIPVYLENRSAKSIKGFTVTGKYDIIYGGQLSDYKSCSVWGYIFGSNVDDYRRQGSMYRWLNPKKITKDNIEIQYIFTDWSAAKAKQDPKYPQRKFITKNYPLYSIEDTEEWVADKLQTINDLMPLTQSSLPRCTKDELWQSDTVYKYYKNPKSIARATKNFSAKDYSDPKLAAESFMMDAGGVGKILAVQGEAKRCKYCSVVDICDQAALLKEQELLKLD